MNVTLFFKPKNDFILNTVTVPSVDMKIYIIEFNSYIGYEIKFEVSKNPRLIYFASNCYYWITFNQKLNVDSCFTPIYAIDISSTKLSYNIKTVCL